MNCQHEHFEFGHYYHIRIDITCDFCGNVIRDVDGIIKFVGDTPLGHHFNIENLFTCMGCSRVVDNVKLVCGGYEVTDWINKKDVWRK